MQLLLCISCYMLTVKLKNLTFEFCFGFFLAVGVLALDSERAFLRALIFCLLHELGHIAVMTICRIDVKKIKFYGGGIKISAEDLDTVSKAKKLWIYSAGCAVNFLLAFIMILLSDYESSLLNLILAVFNLMPISHFDGGMILHILINNHTAENILNASAFTVQVVFALAMLTFSFSTEDYAGIVMYILMLLCSVFE